MDAAIKASDLTKFYGETRAIDHLAFEVERGEIFGFLGPNGAGKTTTIRILTGVIKSDLGERMLKGMVVGCGGGGGGGRLGPLRGSYPAPYPSEP